MAPIKFKAKLNFPQLTTIQTINNYDNGFTQRGENVIITPFFDSRTSTICYVVHDPKTKDALVIDPVMDFDAASGRVFSESIRKLQGFVAEEALNVHWILDTHPHADHLSGSRELGKRLEAPTAIGNQIGLVQKAFASVFNLPTQFKSDGSQFDRLLAHGEVLEAGSIRVEVRHTPGHTPACASFLIGDALFCGDLLFMPEGGCGRCDFPGGSAARMYRSITEQVYTLPDETRIFVGHDYPAGNSPFRFLTSVRDQKANNRYLRAGASAEEFIVAREGRDKTLSVPQLLYYSMQVNIDGGRLPDAEAEGKTYFKLPITVQLD